VRAADRFDLDTDFLSGLASAGDATNAPAAKQLTKIKPLVLILFLLLFISSEIRVSTVSRMRCENR
jgi:hypothetical protein